MGTPEIAEYRTLQERLHTRRAEITKELVELDELLGPAAKTASKGSKLLRRSRKHLGNALASIGASEFNKRPTASQVNNPGLTAAVLQFIVDHPGSKHGDIMKGMDLSGKDVSAELLKLKKSAAITGTGSTKAMAYTALERDPALPLAAE